MTPPLLAAPPPPVRWMLEKGMLDERTAIMCYLLVERLRGPRSAHAAWIDCLPDTFHTPLHFSLAELEELRGTPLSRATPVGGGWVGGQRMKASVGGWVGGWVQKTPPQLVVGGCPPPPIWVGMWVGGAEVQGLGCPGGCRASGECVLLFVELPPHTHHHPQAPCPPFHPPLPRLRFPPSRLCVHSWRSSGISWAPPSTPSYASWAPRRPAWQTTCGHTPSSGPGRWPQLRFRVLGFGGVTLNPHLPPTVSCVCTTVVLHPTLTFMSTTVVLHPTLTCTSTNLVLHPTLHAQVLVLYPTLHARVLVL